MCESR
jgi:hypothetical protein